MMSRKKPIQPPRALLPTAGSRQVCRNHQTGLPEKPSETAQTPLLQHVRLSSCLSSCLAWTMVNCISKTACQSTWQGTHRVSCSSHGCHISHTCLSLCFNTSYMSCWGNFLSLAYFTALKQLEQLFQPSCFSKDFTDSGRAKQRR